MGLHIAFTPGMPAAVIYETRRVTTRLSHWESEDTTRVRPVCSVPAHLNGGRMPRARELRSIVHGATVRDTTATE